MCCAINKKEQTIFIKKMHAKSSTESAGERAKLDRSRKIVYDAMQDSSLLTHGQFFRLNLFCASLLCKKNPLRAQLLSRLKMQVGLVSG